MTYAQQVANNLSNQAVSGAYVQLIYDSDLHFFHKLLLTLGVQGVLEFSSIITYRYLILERRN